MVIKICGCLMFSLLALTAGAQGPGLKADADPSGASEIKNLELELAKLIVKGDWAQYSIHLGDDYVRVGAHGEVENKDEVLAGYRSGKNLILDMIPEDLQVKSYGDTAILNEHLTMLVRQNGHVITSVHRVTEVFIRRAGQWSMVALSDVPMAK